MAFYLPRRAGQRIIPRSYKRKENIDPNKLYMVFGLSDLEEGMNNLLDEKLVENPEGGFMWVPIHPEERKEVSAPRPELEPEKLTKKQMNRYGLNSKIDAATVRTVLNFFADDMKLYEICRITHRSTRTIIDIKRGLYNYLLKDN